MPPTAAATISAKAGERPIPGHFTHRWPVSSSIRGAAAHLKGNVGLDEVVAGEQERREALLLARVHEEPQQLLRNVLVLRLRRGLHRILQKQASGSGLQCYADSQAGVYGGTRVCDRTVFNSECKCGCDTKRRCTSTRKHTRYT